MDSTNIILNERERPHINPDSRYKNVGKRRPNLCTSILFGYVNQSALIFSLYLGTQGQSMKGLYQVGYVKFI